MLLFMIFLPVAFAEGKELIFANVAYRHGARTPVYIYPTDPHQMSTWKEGMRTLTTLGKNQMYDLGSFMRRRYVDFLPLDFNGEVYVESSNYNRTIGSALCVLSGMYNPERDESSPCVLKQVIQVHNINASLDNKINNKVPCPRYNALKEEAFAKNVTQDTKVRYNRTLQNLGKHTNLKFNLTLEDINLSSNVYDTLYVETATNLELPQWTREFYPEPLLEMAHFIDYLIPYYTIELKRLRCGPLMKDMIQHFEDKISGKSKLKMWQYSGHDTTVAHVLNCLNVYDYEIPGYASAAFLELYKNLSNNKYEVLLTYKKNENVIEELTVPGCELYCPFDKFKKLVKDVIPDNWEAECNGSLRIHFNWIVLFVSWIFWYGLN